MIWLLSGGPYKLMNTSGDINKGAVSIHPGIIFL